MSGLFLSKKHWMFMVLFIIQFKLKTKPWLIKDKYFVFLGFHFKNVLNGQKTCINIYFKTCVHVHSLHEMVN